MLDKKKEKIQQDALQSWLDNGKKGTIELTTGHGKTFIAFKAIETMPKNSNILFLAETKIRENTIKVDSLEYKKHYGVNPLESHIFRFACYHSAHKYDLKHWFNNNNPIIVIMDEIHDMLSPVYYKFTKNLIGTNIPCLGLSATVDNKTKFIIDEEEVTKKILLDKFCPIVYSYGLNVAIKNKTTRDLNFYVIQNKLDDKHRNIKSGHAAKPFYQTEAEKYVYLNKTYKMSLFRKYKTTAEKDFAIRTAASNRARFLYSLPSKIKSCKEVLSYLQLKTLVFGLDSKTLLDICPTSIVEENKNYIKDLQDFKSGKTLLTCSNKMLKQGENIPNLKNIILIAYYSKDKDFEQIVGRLRQDNTEGNVIIFCTSGTQEESWFESMTQNMTDVTFRYCPSVEHFLNIFKEN